MAVSRAHSSTKVTDPKLVIVEQTSCIAYPAHFILGEHICNTHILLLAATNGRTRMITNRSNNANAE